MPSEVLSLTYCPTNNLEKIPTYILVTIIQNYIFATLHLCKIMYENKKWKEMGNLKKNHTTVD